MAETATRGVRLILLMLGLGLAGGGYAIWTLSQPDRDQAGAAPPAQDVAPDATTAVADPPPVPDTDAVTDAATDLQPPPEPVDPAPAAPAPPGFDVVRIDPDGAALIAGTAPADAKISIRIDGIEEMRTQAGPDGAFVAQFNLAPNPAPRLMGLVAVLADGTEVAGADEVAIAPIIAVPPVAATEPAPQTEPAPDPAPPAALLLSDEGVAVIQGPEPIATADPADAADVTLDTIAYAPDGAVQLAGRGQGGGGLRLYLDNAPVMDAAVGADGAWAVTMPDISPGLYTLRIDQLGSDGAVTSRFETPFKRETLAALAAAAGSPDAEERPAEPAPPIASITPYPPPVPTITPVPEAAPEPVVTAEAGAEAVQPDASAPPTAPVAAPVAAPVVEPAVEPEVAAIAPVPNLPEVVIAEPQDPAAVPAPDAIIPASPDPATAQVAPPVVAAADPPVEKAPVTVTVQPGFTLWGIATDRFGEGTMYVQVFEANRDRIKDPDLIYPGQVFTLPQE